MTITDEINQISDKVFALEQLNDHLYKALESLTPGGSEFWHDPDKCIEYIQRRLNSVIEQVKKRKGAEVENDQQQADIKRMQPVYDWACQLAQLWDMRFDTLPENSKELVRLYKKAEEE
jgi:predicted secreted protein